MTSSTFIAGKIFYTYRHEKYRLTSELDDYRHASVILNGSIIFTCVT